MRVLQVSSRRDGGGGEGANREFKLVPPKKKIQNPKTKGGGGGKGRILVPVWPVGVAGKGCLVFGCRGRVVGIGVGCIGVGCIGVGCLGTGAGCLV